MPTITDWIQAVTALLALVLASISLIWQFRSARTAREIEVHVEASQRDEGLWALTVSVPKPPRSEALVARLSVCKPKSGRLFNPDDLPLEIPRHDSFVLTLSRPNYAKHGRLEKVRVLERALDHSGPPSSGVDADFGVELPRECEAAWMKVSIFGVGRRRPLISRRMLVSPIA